MRLQSFQEMLAEYEPRGLDDDDFNERKKLLSDYPYSVIVEGYYFEFETLEKWRTINISNKSAQQIWYGKTGYDFGFTELFFASENESLKMIEAIPNIYTSYFAGRTCKSVGYKDDVVYDSSDSNAIMYLD